MRLAKSSNVWLIIDNNSTLWQDPDAEIILQPGAEIIYENGASATIASDVNFQGAGSCFYNKGQLTISANANLNVENDGLIIMDGGELILEDNASLVFDPTSDVLDIRPGSTIRLGNNAEIVVQSQIDAQGTAQQPITFTTMYANPTNQYWRWLKLDNLDPQQPSIIQHAIIEYADYGIYAYQSSPTIQDNTIRNCNYANIYLNYSNPRLENNLLQSAQLNDGLMLNHSSPLLFSNTIQNNNRYGVYCLNYSSPEFGSSTTTDKGNNVIAGNQYGIYAYNYSNPFLGDQYIGKGISVLGGYNSIYSNDSAEVKADIKCDITAQYNWWGFYPVNPLIFEMDASSVIDYANALTSDPNLPQGIAASSNGAEGNDPSLSGGNNPRQLLRLAKQYRVERFPNRFRRRKPFPSVRTIPTRLTRRLLSNTSFRKQHR